MVHHERQRKTWCTCRPGFQDNAKKAADFLELGSEAAMQQMMDARPECWNLKGVVDEKIWWTLLILLFFFMGGYTDLKLTKA